MGLNETSFLASLTVVIASPLTWIMVGVALISGLTRGFSGFGGALIFVPIAGAILGPRIAVPMFFVMDLFTASPWALRKLPECDLKAMAPIFIGTLLFLPLGALALGAFDPLILRWGTAIPVAAMLGFLVTGWRYPGTPSIPVSVGVGGTAGFLYGSTGIPGPIIIAYWLASPVAASVIRTNIMVYYASSSLFTNLVFWLKGLLSWYIVANVLVFAPTYALGLAGGSWFFKRTSERSYRNLALLMIAISTLISLPIFDGYFRK